jgi:hypothetical protein
MNPEWELDAKRKEDLTPAERIEGLRSTLELHRELMRQKAEIREQPDALSARLEEMAEEPIDEEDVPEAIRLLIEAEQVRAVQIDELDERLDEVIDSYMVGSIAIVERLAPGDDSG